MTGDSYDLVVIGGGSAGVRAARMAATRGARVAIIEADRLGGTCVNVGCVPKKLMVYASAFAGAVTDAAGFGWQVSEAEFDWQRFIAAQDAEIRRLNGVYQRLLERTGVDVIDGRARLESARRVTVDDRTLEADNLVLATGGRPFVPDVPGAGFGVVSDAVFSLPELPRRLAIVGGGYIAAEFAGIFAGLGVEVTLIYRGPLFLRGFDNDIRASLATEMTRRGIELRFNVDIDRLEAVDGGVMVAGRDGESFTADLVLWATGRVPCTSKLGLEEVGVDLDPNGAVVVDELSATSVDGVWAIGDCTDRMALTPVAIAEAMALVETLDGNPTAVDYANIPTAVFSQPPAATVGLREDEARAAGHAVDIYRSTFRPLAHTLSGREEHTMMKLVVDRETDRVLGVHMVGADAAEIVQGFAVALKTGATKRQLDATVGIHPTAAEEFVTMRRPVDPTPDHPAR